MMAWESYGMGEFCLGGHIEGMLYSTVSGG